MDQHATEIIETLNLILARMATKDDVEALRVEMREGFANIQAASAFGWTRLKSLPRLKRLATQARMIDPIARHFLVSAGIREGMQVLDVGSGAGDVAILLAIPQASAPLLLQFCVLVALCPTVVHPPKRVTLPSAP
jgi:hypothetical protein